MVVSSRKLWGMVRHVCLILALAVALCPVQALGKTYAQGNLRYTVDDYSVTITNYVGIEETVDVPAMIGGNPVNVIASGAFENAESVTTVYLPSSIVEVQMGAFAQGQRVVYASELEGTGAGTGSGEDEDTGSTDGNGGGAQDQPEGEGASSAQGPQGSQGTQDPQGPQSDPSKLGVIDDAGNLVTVDDEGNLVLVRTDGIELVLDDARTYARSTSGDGKTTIVTDEGEEVQVGENAVSYQTSDGGTVVFDSRTGARLADASEATGSDAVIEVAEADEKGSPVTDEADGEVAEGALDDDADDAQDAADAGAAGTAVVPLVLLAGVVAAGAAVLFARKRAGR